MLLENAAFVNLWVWDKVNVMLFFSFFAIKSSGLLILEVGKISIDVSVSNPICAYHRIWSLHHYCKSTHGLVISCYKRKVLPPISVQITSRYVEGCKICLIQLRDEKRSWPRFSE